MLVILSLTSCKVTDDNIFRRNVLNFKDSFTKQGKFDRKWEDDSQDSPPSYLLENGYLKITTRPQVSDRVKVKTKRGNFGVGSYKWRIYVPQYDLYDKCNIGAFLFHSGEKNYEIDFEIGSGTMDHRDELNASFNEVIVHCTSQISPHETELFKIVSEKWHDFEIVLINGENDKYIIKWYINNTLVKTMQSDINSNITFSVHNSLENLNFIGEQLPTKENYVLFDHFIFKGIWYF